MNNTTMTQQEIMTDLLTTEKSLIKLYASNITESSCPNLRQLLFNIMSECSQDQFTVFDQMRSKNMYQVKTVQQNDINTAKQTIQDLKNQTGM
ncbi:MAG: spore coat protein [Clostridiales bacterium]|nr:spore coat protein [Clostridiales bacterium]